MGKALTGTSLNQKIFSNISKIIERDSKSTTYKFALLRGLTDIINCNSPFIKFEKDRAVFPLGLMIEKWIIYYYPILEATVEVPQINNSKQLAFETDLRALIKYYKNKGGFSVFYNDYCQGNLPEEISPTVLNLVKKLKNTITKMPMKYIGRSLSNEYYSVFSYQQPRQSRTIHKSVIDPFFLVTHFGTFSISLEYYEAFKLFGSFINGQDSILFKWAEFSVSKSDKNINTSQVLNEVLKSPVTQREIGATKKLYREIIEKEGSLFCVWTGKRLTSYDIDHLIPFSIWKNNELWNLMPSDSRINKAKLDKIPSPTLLEDQSELILNYWRSVLQQYEKRFTKEINLSLIGEMEIKGNNDMLEQALKKLKSTCHYLIEERGFEFWNRKSKI